MTIPRPEGIRALREAAKLSQSEAAALVHAARRTWQNWEAPVGSGNYRPIDPAAWELFEDKAKKAVEAFDRLTTSEAILAEADKLIMIRPGQFERFRYVAGKPDLSRG